MLDMPAQPSREAAKRRYRSLFVSDVHLGCRYSQANEFLAFLNQIEVDQLYLVGDFIDGWRLKRRWHWQLVYVRILQRLVQLASQGTQVFYTPGNHDEFLRDYLHDFGLITVADQFVHCTADGRRFVVLHGDQFDDVERRARWLSVIGACAYDTLVSANGMVNRVRRSLRLCDYRFSNRMKFWAKQAVQFISDFEERLVYHAKERNCQGVICGHVHVPRLDYFGDIVYCNTGDWVEHCTGLVELESGKLELIEWANDRLRPLQIDPHWHSPPNEPVFQEAESLAATVSLQLPVAASPQESIRPASIAGLFR